jgi:hypothetical protein
MKTSKNLLPTLDIGSHSNAGGEPRPMAEATQERKLLGVGSSAWLGVMADDNRSSPRLG